jgi:hypothetical protein
MQYQEEALALLVKMKIAMRRTEIAPIDFINLDKILTVPAYDFAIEGNQTESITSEGCVKRWEKPKDDQVQ